MAVKMVDRHEQVSSNGRGQGVQQGLDIGGADARVRATGKTPNRVASRFACGHEEKTLGSLRDGAALYGESNYSTVHTLEQEIRAAGVVPNFD